VSDVREDFKRSSRFGLIGVGVVAVLTAAIALLFGSNSANPTGALIAIFVIIFGFVAVLLLVQRRDVDSAEANAKLAAVARTEPVTDPTMVELPSLLAALAIKPIDQEAVALASGRTWKMARASIQSGAILLVLIFCAVVPFELTHEYWSMVTFVPVIIIYAVYLAVRTLMPGGQLDQAYDDSAATLEPLGLTVTERLQVKIRRQPFGQQPLRHEVEGATAYSGERHGRAVSIRITGGATTTLSGAVEPFEVKAKSERLRATPSSPASIAAAVEPLRASSYWKGVAARGGPSGIVVERKGGGGEHWMRDLWLAERLAEAAGPA
jgi:hypothetical protein